MHTTPMRKRSSRAAYVHTLCSFAYARMEIAAIRMHTAPMRELSRRAANVCARFATWE